jgi:nitric oxide reductase activation protein
VKADYVLHEKVCIHVRDLVSREARRTRTRRSWGNLDDGIDWKATIAARARGEQAVYVKQRCRAVDLGELDEHTPVVFLFSNDIEGCDLQLIHDGNLAQRNLNLRNTRFPFDRHPKPDFVYSVLRAVRKTAYAFGGHIRKEWNAALALLYTRSAMGVERYEAIRKRSERYQCRVMPEEDQELCDLPSEERVVAWAIKHAEQVVIIVAHDGWSLSERLERFARERRVRIIIVPLSTLPAGLIRRLQVTYLISTRLKKHPQQETILRRAID